MNEELIQEWFETHTPSSLNIYVLALILVEHNVNEEKNKAVEEALEYILNTLILRGKLKPHHKAMVYEEIREEKEAIVAFRELLFEISNHPNLLQKDKFMENKKEPMKLLFCKPESRNHFSFGHIKK